MSTLEKGTAFEKKVYNIIEELLSMDQFFISGKNYKLFHQKEYYSQARQGNIKVDISIEFSRQPESKPNLYILMECKDYNHSVPVDDIEEFSSKAGQITGLNVKSIFITTACLQKSAYIFAQSNGIAVIRILEDDALEWLIERSNPHLKASEENARVLNVFNTMLEEHPITYSQAFFAIDGSKPYTDFSILLSDIVKADMTQSLIS